MVKLLRIRKTRLRTSNPSLLERRDRLTLEDAPERGHGNLKGNLSYLDFQRVVCLVN